MSTRRTLTGRRFGEARLARAFAVAVPCAAFALFVAASVLQAKWHGLAYVRAFAEAALVGAGAAWIALVSVFRRPFGLPLPNTALLPRYRERLTRELADYVCERLLAPENVATRLREFDVSGRLATWLGDPANVAALARGARDAPAAASAFLRDERVRAAAGDALARGVDAIPAAPLAARALTLLVTNGYHQNAFDAGVEIAARYVDRHRSDLQRMGQNALPFSGFIGTLVFDGLTTELVAALASARRADHPWRATLARSIEGTIEALARDPAMAERAERVKNELASPAAIDGSLAWLSEALEARESAVTEAALARGLAAFAAKLESDAATREAVDACAEGLIMTALVAKREAIGAFLTRRVASWNPDRLGGALDERIRDDLAALIVNATLAGGVAGLLLFTLSGLL